ncbi:FliH/SctL family protein [Pseudotabrizicola sp. L79]|uniref:FliH/SctL family protein n=1 Tax=Pseudotabrizicola sp. L79 TaxID=3118402 RepID=UPI002F93DFCA
MPLKLEVFETRAAVSDVVVMQSTEVEDARLQSYETGYAAGWEDAMAADAEEARKISAELANNLQHLAFTYQEARAHLLRSVQPVLIELATRLLPEVAREAIAPVVLDAVMPLLEDASDQPIDIVLNPVARPAIERLLTQAAGLPLQFQEEPTLGEGQVYIRMRQEEFRVDLDTATRDIIRAVHDFFDCPEKEDSNG